MFWHKKKDETRNVRRTVWKPTPKAGLMDKAGRGIDSENINKRNNTANVRNKNAKLNNTYQQNINSTNNRLSESRIAKSQLVEINSQKRISDVVAGQTAVINKTTTFQNRQNQANLSNADGQGVYSRSTQINRILDKDIINSDKEFSSSYSDIADINNKNKKEISPNSLSGSTAGVFVKGNKKTAENIKREQFSNRFEDNNNSEPQNFKSIDDSQTNAENQEVDFEFSADSPPKTLYNYLRTIAVAITLMFLVLTYFLDPWLWQNIRNLRSNTVVDKDKPIVIVVHKQNLNQNKATEEDYFITLERILSAYPSAVGFYGSIADWLPISNDPLQISRINQLLIRYPNVVVSAPANLIEKSFENTLDSKKVVVSERNKLPLKNEDFEKIRAISIEESPTLFDKAMGNMNLGFILKSEYWENENESENVAKKIVKTSELATSYALANIDNKPQENTSAFFEGVLSFPLMLSVIANGQKPQDLKIQKTINSKIIQSSNFELPINKSGKFLPSINIKNFPDVLNWQTLFTVEKKDFTRIFKNRAVIIGLDDKLVYLPKSNNGNFPALSWGKLFNFGLETSELLSIPAVLWQANIYASIQSSSASSAPEVVINGYISLTVMMIIVLLLWVNRNFSQKLMVMVLILVLAIILVFSLSYSHYSAILYGIAILPVLLMANGARRSHLQTMKKWKNLCNNSANLEEMGIDSKNGDEDKNNKSLSDIIPTDDELENNSEQAVIKNQVVGEYFAEEKNKNQFTDSIKQGIFGNGNSNIYKSQNETNFENNNNNSSQSISKIKPQPEVQNSDSKNIATPHLPPFKSLPPLPPEKSNPFVSFPEEVIVENDVGEIINEDNKVINPEQARWRDGWNWDENQKIVTNLAEKVIRQKDEAPVPQTSVGNTRIFNQALVEDIENDKNKFKIGRYIVERVLGKGAMGVVYLGVDPHIERKVAIKTVPLPTEEIHGSNDQLARKFFREAQAAGRLTHPGIVTIYDAGLFQNNVYMAMEFLEGQDLANFVKADKLLPLVTVLSIVARVAEALHFAHENGVIHRDIKPANIIFNSSQNTVKVTDFGIAHIHDSNRAMTQVLVGSPNYMSPEHLTGENLDGRSDLFSLAVTLYVLCCGATPFYADNVNRLMYCIINDPPRDIRSFKANIPDTVVQILNKALSKNREHRYSSGASMAQDLLYALKQILNHV